ncbi:MAG TPA: response regulator [Alphaproteobacteria bacterium]
MSHHNILVVDDFEAMRQIIRRFLGMFGLRNVEEAEDGTAALAKLAEKKFTLVIADWKMAPMDGIELLRRMRAESRYKEIPFLMVTSATEPSSVTTARAAGVDGYIAKPFSAAMLREKIEGICGPLSRAGTAAHDARPIPPKPRQIVRPVA